MKDKEKRYQKKILRNVSSETPINRPPSDYVADEKQLSIFANPIEGILLQRQGYKPLGGRRYGKIKHDPGYKGTDYSLSAEVEISTTCEKCAETYSYHYTTGYNRGDDPISPEKVAKRAMRSNPEPRECPKCGRYQKWMRVDAIKKYLADVFGLSLLLLLIGPVGAGTIEYVIWKPTFNSINYWPFSALVVVFAIWALSIFTTTIACYFSKSVMTTIGTQDSFSFSEGHIAPIGPQFYKLVFQLMIPVIGLIYFIIGIITIVVGLLSWLRIVPSEGLVLIPALFASIIALGAIVMINASILINSFNLYLRTIPLPKPIPLPDIPLPKISRKKFGLILVISGIALFIFLIVVQPKALDDVVAVISCLPWLLVMTGASLMSSKKK